jgi:hypothetical protein
MKKLWIILIVLFAIAANKSSAEDTIYLKTGEKIFANVKIAYIDKIVYQEPNNSEKNVLPISKIFKIKYEDGTSEIFNASEEPITLNRETSLKNSSICRGVNNKKRNLSIIFGSALGVGNP